MRQNLFFNSLFNNYSLFDYDNNGYSSVIIGDQEWIVQNYKTIHYADGTSIPNLAQNEDIDWFLPSKDELSEMYTKLHLYGIGGFTGDEHMSSSEFNATEFWIIHFGSGSAYNGPKTDSTRIRPCRIFTSVSPSYFLRDIGPTGGFIFWISGNDYLEAYYKDLNLDQVQHWSNIIDQSIGTAGTAIGTGQANTNAIIGQAGHTSSAAKLCDNLSTSGWINDASGAYCEYDNSTGLYVNSYGYLYNWYAVNSSHGLVYFKRNGIQETDWKVPGQTDISTLISFLGGISIAGGKLKEIGISRWTTPNTGATDDYGFRALPGGQRNNLGIFNSILTDAIFWTNKESVIPSYGLDYGTIYNGTALGAGDYFKIAGRSIRCVRDLKLYDLIKPCFIQNTERNNMDPSTDTSWIISTHDAGSKIITFNQDLPLEIGSAGTSWKTMWSVHTTVGNYARIISVDFPAKQITYDISIGTLSVSQRARFLNPFRSFYLNPADKVIDLPSWGHLYCWPQGVWKHSDGNYRMCVGSLTASGAGSSGLYSSPDLINWTDIIGNYIYKANTAPFNQSWCVHTTAHNLYGSPVKIPGTNYYARMAFGADSVPRGQSNIIVHDEDLNIINMPTTAISIPSYSVDSTHTTNPGGMCIYHDKWYYTIEYRTTAVGSFNNVDDKILLVEIDNPYDRNVISVEEVTSNLIPNSFCSLTQLQPCPIVWNDQLYVTYCGENDDLSDSPLLANEEMGIASKVNGVWTTHPQSPLIINPIEMDSIYPGTTWAKDHLGTSTSFIHVGSKLHMFIAMNNGTNTYRIAKLDLDL